MTREIRAELLDELLSGYEKLADLPVLNVVALPIQPWTHWFRQRRPIWVITAPVTPELSR
jgi:hypothetical protein